MTIRKGDKLKVLPQHTTDAADAAIVYEALEDEDGGRVRIVALLGMTINPQYIYPTSILTKEN